MQQNSGKGLMAELNVTPLVDVMLVLLVVFMVTVPLLMPQTLKVNLPRTVSLKQNQQMVTTALVVQPDSSLQYGGKTISDTELQERLKQDAQIENFQLQIQADTMVPYGRIAQVMAIAQADGVARIGFSTIVQRPH